jgi:hypothetical protein
LQVRETSRRPRTRSDRRRRHHRLWRPEPQTGPTSRARHAAAAVAGAEGGWHQNCRRSDRQCSCPNSKHATALETLSKPRNKMVCSVQKRCKNVFLAASRIADSVRGVPTTAHARGRPTTFPLVIGTTSARIDVCTQEWRHQATRNYLHGARSSY